MLADSTDVQGVGTDELAEPLDDVFRRQFAVVRRGEPEWESLPPTVELTPPRRVVTLPAGRVLGLDGDHQIGDDLAAVADDGHVGGAVLGDLGRVDVGVYDSGLWANVDNFPVTRSSKRAPNATIRSDRCSAVTAATLPCIPGIEVAPVAVRERAAGGERRHDGDAGQLDQPAQLCPCARSDHPATDVEHRATGVDDQPSRLLTCLECGRVVGRYPGRLISPGQAKVVCACKASLATSTRTGPGRPVPAMWKASATVGESRPGRSPGSCVW